MQTAFGLPTDLAETDGRQAHDPLDVFDAIFGRCSGDSLIGFASLRPGRARSDPYPHALTGIPIGSRREWLPDLFRHELETGHTQYFCPNPFSRTCISKPDDPGRTVGEHASLYWINAANRHVSELCPLVVDLDCYQDPLRLTPGQALGKAGEQIGGRTRLGGTRNAIHRRVAGQGVVLSQFVDDHGEGQT